MIVAEGVANEGRYAKQIRHTPSARPVSGRRAGDSVDWRGRGHVGRIHNLQRA